LPRGDLVDCPGGVFADEGLVIVEGAVEGRQIIVRAYIAEGDADIAEKPASFGAKDGRAAEEGFEFCLIEGE
jgi:hypothetical protein